MSSVYNIYGFTGKIWEEPNIDELKTSELLATYTHILYTVVDNGKFYLGTRDSIDANYGSTLARAVLNNTPLITELSEPTELNVSEWRLVTDARESNGTTHFPSKEKIVCNGRRFFATEDNGDSRYVIELSNTMGREADPVIGTTDAFYDCELMEANNENITKHYYNSVILVGGIFLDVKSMYDYLGTGVNLNSSIGGWLPILYKKVAECIPPHEVGLTWPIKLGDLKDPDLYRRLLEHRTSRLVVFREKSPITYEKVPISRLYPHHIQGILCYDDRPSPNRVTDMHKIKRCPEMNALYPEFDDLEDNNNSVVTIRYVVKDIAPEEHTINFITYEVAQ